jgi:hypothetical protein
VFIRLPCPTKITGIRSAIEDLSRRPSITTQTSRTALHNQQIEAESQRFLRRFGGADFFALACAAGFAARAG